MIALKYGYLQHHRQNIAAVQMQIEFPPGKVGNGTELSNKKIFRKLPHTGQLSISAQVDGKNSDMLKTLINFPTARRFRRKMKTEKIRRGHSLARQYFFIAIRKTHQRIIEFQVEKMKREKLFA